MKELKCPKCGSVFQVDETEYASIVSQVKNAEFDAEVKDRVAEVSRRLETERKFDVAQAERLYNEKLNEKENVLIAKETEISQLKKDLESAESKTAAAITLAVAEKDKEIVRLQSEVSENDSRTKIAMMEVENKAKDMLQSAKDKAKDELREKEDRIRDLEKQAILDAQAAAERERGLQEQHKKELDMKDEVIAQYKDFKLSLSTKMIGESLEVYCSNQYEKTVRPFMPEAKFGKDNDVYDHTKGDFIFRDIVDGLESVSIMFEMKNEADATATKHKNNEFFEKLDRDRKKKNCEYAVLVSMLELDNDLYNNGIYAVSDYEKMYVVRPQQFLTIISILVQMGRNTIKVKQELEKARNRDIDVSNFEARIEKIKKIFGGHIKDAANRYNDALQDIDKAIEQLTNMKEHLRLWVDHLYEAEGNLEDLTVRKLTSKNPTMQAKFEEARKIAIEQQ